MNEVIIHKGRVNTIIVNLGFDVSTDTISSEIRTSPSVDATLIAAWGVSFDTDGTDGVLKLVLDDSDRTISASKGYMDLKRLVAGNPYSVFDKPLEVDIQATVTA